MEGEWAWASGLVSPVRRNPHLLYKRDSRTVSGRDPETEAIARRSRAQAITASTRAPPTPRPRAGGATNIPTSTGRGSFGSSGSFARPLASPIHSPSRSAINVTRSAPEAPRSARSCHTCFGERLLASQCRAKRHRRVCQGGQPEGSQFQSLIWADPPNLWGSFAGRFQRDEEQVAESVSHGRKAQCPSEALIFSLA